eukprot:577552-Alexandrium_andersonii.AAC.1
MARVASSAKASWMRLQSKPCQSTERYSTHPGMHPKSETSQFQCTALGLGVCKCWRIPCAGEDGSALGEAYTAA